MKTYVITVSRYFPATHPRKGEKTYFEYKILSAIFKQTYYPVECSKCGWLGWSHFLDGGGQIADTGDYGDMFCPKCGSEQIDSIEEEGLTYYKENKNVWPKIHTIRANYPLWKKRIDEVNEGKAVLSVRYWSGKPYNSKQVEILKLDKDSGVGTQKLHFFENDIECPYAFEQNGIANHAIDEVDDIAYNDGLSLSDFKAWFKGYDLTKEMAIIHFTNYRY